MTLSIVFCAFSVLCLFMFFESSSAAPMVNDNLQQNKFGRSLEKTKDCQVNKKYEDSNWVGKAVPITAYVDQEEDAGAVSFSVTSDGKDKNLYRDFIIFTQKENMMYEYRNGNFKEKPLGTYVDVSGWTTMEISMNDQEIIVKVMGVSILKYTVSFPVKGLVIHGSNITVCEDNTPTWLVQEEVLVTIPLEPSRQVVNHFGNRTYALSLSSEDECTPCIGIGEDRKCLAQDFSIEQSFSLHLELITGYIIVYQQFEGKRENIISLYKQEMKYIEVSSDNCKVSVSLTIFAQPKAILPSRDSTVNSSYGTDIYLGFGIGITTGIVVSLAVAIVVMMIRQKMVTNNVDNSNEKLNESTPFTTADEFT